MARLAGLPSAVVGRAREILRNLEGEEFDERGQPRLAGAGAGEPPEGGQLGLFAGGAADLRPGEAAALRTLRSLDPNRTTPLEALDVLARLVAGVRREGER